MICVGIRERVQIALAVAALAAAATVGQFSPPTAAADPVTTTALVLEVVDGDTIDILDDDRGHLRVRVLGIDTPETKKPGYTVGCWGPEATKFATSAMLGRRVAVETDPTQDRTDRFGRTLAYLVRSDGWDYSVEAARAGAARAYVYGGRPVSRYDAIVAAEREARAAGRGLWGPPCNGHTESIASGSDASPSATAPQGLLEPPSNVYYRYCADARAAGAAPLRRGEPGYRSALDRDGDGIACEG